MSLTFLNLEILLKFSLKVLRFTLNSKITEYNTKVNLWEEPKINDLKFSFSLKFKKKCLKLQLN